MKNFSVIIFALAAFPFCAFASDTVSANAPAVQSVPATAVAPQSIAHRVEAVSVFTDRAVVTRTGTANLKKGKNEIVFAGIRDNFDLRSIRAGDAVPSGVEILGVSWERQVSRTVDHDKIAKLETELDALQKEKYRLENALTSARSRLNVVRQYQEIFREKLERDSVSTLERSDADYEETATTLNAKAEKLFSQINEISEEIRLQVQKINPLERELRMTYGHGNAHQTLSLIVTLNAENDMTAKIPVSYMTRSAYWMPRYDAYVSDSEKTVDFAYNGLIRQNTSEAWNDVRVTLSTAQPQVSALPPKLPTIALSGHSSSNRQIVQVEAAAPMDAIVPQNAKPTFVDRDAGGAPKTEEALSSVRTQGPAVTFEIAGTQTILSGNQPHQVSIARKAFENVELCYEAAPTIRSGVYLRANLKNETLYPILNGELSIYRNSGFIGKSALKYTPVNATFSFFAGTVDGLSAAVEHLVPLYEKGGKLFSSFSSKSGKPDVLDGDIYTLANIMGTPCKVRVRSQIKVSEIDDVKISILKKAFERIPATTPGYVLEKDTGLLYWDVELPANGETTLNLTTKTEY